LCLLQGTGSAVLCTHASSSCKWGLFERLSKQQNSGISDWQMQTHWEIDKIVFASSKFDLASSESKMPFLMTGFVHQIYIGWHKKMWSTAPDWPFLAQQFKSKKPNSNKVTKFGLESSFGPKWFEWALLKDNWVCFGKESSSQDWASRGTVWKGINPFDFRTT